MPQLDFFTIFFQVIQFFMLFWILYFYLLKYILPNIYKSLKVRNNKFKSLESILLYKIPSITNLRKKEFKNLFIHYNRIYLNIYSIYSTIVYVYNLKFFFFVYNFFMLNYKGFFVKANIINKKNLNLLISKYLLKI